MVTAIYSNNFYSVKFSEAVSLDIQMDNCKIVRLNVVGLPLQPRILDPSIEEVRNYFSNYGISFATWLNDKPENVVEEVSKFGIFPENVLTEIIAIALK